MAVIQIICYSDTKGHFEQGKTQQRFVVDMNVDRQML